MTLRRWALLGVLFAGGWVQAQEQQVKAPEVKEAEDDPGRFRVGINLGIVSLPRPLLIEGYARVHPYLGIAGNWSYFPKFASDALLNWAGAQSETTKGELNDFSGWEIALRVYPMRGTSGSRSLQRRDAQLRGGNGRLPVDEAPGMPDAARQRIAPALDSACPGLLPARVGARSGGGTGRRSGLKIRGPKGHPRSIRGPSTGFPEGSAWPWGPGEQPQRAPDPGSAPVLGTCRRCARGTAIDGITRQSAARALGRWFTL